MLEPWLNPTGTGLPSARPGNGIPARPAPPARRRVGGCAIAQSMNDTVPDDAFLAAAADLLGPRGLTTDSDLIAPWLTDWRGRFTGSARALAAPASTAELAALVRLCATHAVPLVPQGGNTGMCGGATPDTSGTALLLSLRRMDTIGPVDRESRQVTCGAGAILERLHQAAEAVDLRFPLTLGGKAAAVPTLNVIVVNQCPMTLTNEVRLAGISAIDDPAKPDPKAPTTFDISAYDLELAGNLSGTGGLIKDGAGTLTLSGVNTCTGPVQLKAGVLAYAHATAVGQGPLTISDGAKLQLRYAGTRPIPALSLNGGATLPNGSYGSSQSPATFKNDTYFEGPGTITVGPLR